MKALKPAFVISLLANAILAWLLWNRTAPNLRIADAAKADARPAGMPLPAVPRWNPSEDLRLRDPFAAKVDASLFTTDHPTAQIPDTPVVRHYTRPLKMGPDVRALDSDILRPAQHMAPYPSYRESQLQRGLYPGSPRRLP